MVLRCVGKACSRLLVTCLGCLPKMHSKKNGQVSPFYAILGPFHLQTLEHCIARLFPIFVTSKPIYCLMSSCCTETAPYEPRLPVAEIFYPCMQVAAILSQKVGSFSNKFTVSFQTKITLLR